ncbi:putative ankyrin repeat protein RF_0381 [Ostrea edulis]|uniref:putative ankyrin repeat protein RF_0381 n=1 Tax=Ostrea edulis TaxID=37623 RepID=UPI0024AF7FE8|nr:putative ankyrin repeat protein RF_0381 [Ostrea edulis]
MDQQGVVGLFLALFIGVAYVFEMRLDKVYQEGIKRDKELSIIKIRNKDLEAKVQLLKDEGDLEGIILLLVKRRNEDLEAKIHMLEGNVGDITSLQTPTDNEQNYYKGEDIPNALNEACKNVKLETCEYLIQIYPELLLSVDNDGGNTALYAAHRGNVKILQLLADNKVDVKHKDNNGWNILHTACRNSHLEMSRYIIQTYPDLLHSVDNDEWNAALHAARGGNVNILKLLADNEVDVKHKSKTGWNILSVAGIYANFEMSRYIIQTYPDLLHSADNDGWNAALHAARGGNVKILQLLADNEVDVKHINKYSWNILHVACRQSNVEMSRYIIQTYPDLLHTVNNAGWNAALHTARGGNVKILQILADNEVDVKHKDNDGWNILHVAFLKSNLKMSCYIIQTYPDLFHSVDNDGWNAALHAARGGNVRILQLLAYNKVDVKHINKYSWNILHVACRHSNLKMSRYIIQRYPDLLHSVDNDGWNTALHAARGGNVKILQLLVDKKVDVKHKNKYGRNILHVVCKHSNLEMSRYIIQKYPDLLHSKDYNGQNAAFFAVQGGNAKILQLLTDNGVKT